MPPSGPHPGRTAGANGLRNVPDSGILPGGLRLPPVGKRVMRLCFRFHGLLYFLEEETHVIWSPFISFPGVGEWRGERPEV